MSEVKSTRWLDEDEVKKLGDIPKDDVVRLQGHWYFKKVGEENRLFGPFEDEMKARKSYHEYLSVVK